MTISGAIRVLMSHCVGDSVRGEFGNPNAMLLGPSGAPPGPFRGPSAPPLTLPPGTPETSSPEKYVLPLFPEQREPDPKPPVRQRRPRTRREPDLFDEWRKFYATFGGNARRGRCIRHFKAQLRRFSDRGSERAAFEELLRLTEFYAATCARIDRRLKDGEGLLNPKNGMLDEDWIRTLAPGCRTPADTRAQEERMKREAEARRRERERAGGRAPVDASKVTLGELKQLVEQRKGGRRD